jgi:hypothetical protein
MVTCPKIFCLIVWICAVTLCTWTNSAGEIQSELLSSLPLILGIACRRESREAACISTCIGTLGDTMILAQCAAATAVGRGNQPVKMIPYAHRPLSARRVRTVPTTSRHRSAQLRPKLLPDRVPRLAASFRQRPHEACSADRLTDRAFPQLPLHPSGRETGETTARDIWRNRAICVPMLRDSAGSGSSPEQS